MMDHFLAGISEFHFIRPGWLIGLFVVLGFYLWRRKRRAHSVIDDLVDVHLQTVVVEIPVQQSSKSVTQLLLLLIAVLTVALAGPSWQRLPQPLFQLQQGRVLVLSLSESMGKRDLKPSRLARAQFKLVDLLASAPGVLNGLVGFAGEAFVVAPLSDDQDTIINLLEALDTQTLPVQGIRAERGLQKAAELLARVNIDTGEVILVADQVSPLAVTAAAQLLDKAISVSVLEVASEENTEHSALFKSIAKAGGGVYARMSADDDDIRRLNARLFTWLARANSKTTESQRQADQWRDMGPYLLIPILLLSSLLFRQGWLVRASSIILPLIFMSFLPSPVRAFELQNLWQRATQTQWQAAQAYEEQDYPAALEGFEKDHSANGYYNQANTLARLAQYARAITAYDSALALKPDFEDAQFNRELVEAAMEKEREEQAKQASDEQDQEDSQDDSKADESQGEQSEQDKSGDDESDSEVSDREGQSSAGDNATQTDNSSGEPAGFGTVTDRENEQAMEMMLRQVHDDPGALLKRKFARQYADQQARGRQE